jgi:hypothetical protein
MRRGRSGIAHFEFFEIVDEYLRLSQHGVLDQPSRSDRPPENCLEVRGL